MCCLSSLLSFGTLQVEYMPYLIFVCGIVLQPSIMSYYPHVGKATGKLPGSHACAWGNSMLDHMAHIVMEGIYVKGSQ